MDFFPTIWLLTGIPMICKKLHIIYQYYYQLLMLLLGRISSGAIISHHLKIESLGLEKDLAL